MLFRQKRRSGISEQLCTQKTTCITNRLHSLRLYLQALFPVAWEKADCEGTRSSSSCFLCTLAVIFQLSSSSRDLKIQLGHALQTDWDSDSFQSSALFFTQAVFTPMQEDIQEQIPLFSMFFFSFDQLWAVSNQVYESRRGRERGQGRRRNSTLSHPVHYLAEDLYAPFLNIEMISFNY